MQVEDAIKVGFLSIPPHNILRKTWSKRYCALYDASDHGIQRIEVFESEDACAKQSGAKIIPMTDIWKVAALPEKKQPNVFEIRTKSCSYQFSTDTFQDMSDWLASLQSLDFSKNQAKPSRPASPTDEPCAKKALKNQPTPTDEKKIQEENLLYCPMDEHEVYMVKAEPTDAALRNNLKGDYGLIVTSVDFSITEENSEGRIGKVVLTWPFQFLRKYGCNNDSFFFKVARKCSSGEGLYTFATNDGRKIYQSIDSNCSALCKKEEFRKLMDESQEWEQSQKENLGEWSDSESD